jgi:hypothetical protein
LSIAYGIEVHPENDPLVLLAERGGNATNKAFRPGYYLVDAIPWLQYLPRWFPGAQFHKDAEQFREAIFAMRDVPFKQVKQAFVSLVYCLVLFVELNHYSGNREGRTLDCS